MDANLDNLDCLENIKTDEGKGTATNVLEGSFCSLSVGRKRRVINHREAPMPEYMVEDFEREQETTPYVNSAN